MTDPIINFGRNEGIPISQITDQSFLAWMADPKRTVGKDKQSFAIDDDLFNAAVSMREKFIAAEDLRLLAQRIMGGHPTGYENNVFIIQMEGDSRSKNGSYVLDNTIHQTLDEALEALAVEYPIENNVRQTPGAEDDQIIVWEVTPEGFRKPAWVFAGYYFGSDHYACGLGKLPGDEQDLMSLAFAND